jgi:hypothetical protein
MSYVRRPRKKPPDLEVTIRPPETPDPERTARCLRKLHALAERILAREAREKEKRNDAA